MNAIALSDNELIARYLDGDESDLKSLIVRHQKKVFSYIMLSVKNRELAEDIFQETFIKAIVTIKQGRYTETGKFRAWISRIAHNLIIDHFRQKKNENTVSNDEAPVDLLNNPSLCDGTIEDEIVRLQITSDIRKLISYLPDSQREVLEMRYYQDLSFKEIADQTGVSINTALGRMRYAILNIRRMADEHDIVLTM